MVDKMGSGIGNLCTTRVQTARSSSAQITVCTASDYPAQQKGVWGWKIPQFKKYTRLKLYVPGQVNELVEHDSQKSVEDYTGGHRRGAMREYRIHPSGTLKFEGNLAN